MILASLNDWTTVEFLHQIIHQYETLGVLFGLLLPFIDSFLGFLPLWVIVGVNVSCFGFWPGFIVSYIGSVLGTTSLFLLLRKLGRNKVTNFLYRPNKKHPVLNWIDHSGFGPVFILFCFPFTPSFFTNIFAAVSKIRTTPYLIGIALGKFIMIFIVSVIGHDIQSLLKHPVKSIYVLLVIGVLWYAGKLVEKRLSKIQTSNEPVINERIS
ncbi:MAG: hypothetical protein K0R18_2391 [Bacillales bacterium]|jgi:uncharacterized membrane protein YdjX (TVP38/TMEM64 family)|nr:hypothetical protein [Bacillales bacterium]